VPITVTVSFSCPDDGAVNRWPSGIDRAISINAVVNITIALSAEARRPGTAMRGCVMSLDQSELAIGDTDRDRQLRRGAGPFRFLFRG